MTADPPVAAGRDDWDQHWSDYSQAAENNPAQSYRRRLVLRRLRGEDAPDRIVDIGSGQGDLAVELRAAFPSAEIAGVEYSRSGVEISTAKLPDAKFVQVDLLHPVTVAPDLLGRATHAVCSEVLEHVDDPVTLVRNARALLAPGATVVVTVPGGPMSAFDRHIGHRRHFRGPELRAVLEAAGLDVRSVALTGFPFFNLYRLAVILRGRKLIEESQAEAPPSRLQLVVSKIFDVLFRLNLANTPLGWQVVAVAREPRRATD